MAFPIEEDEHWWSVLRYVERNALRANLVRRAEDWRWSSAAMGHGGKYAALRTGQLPFPTQYNLRVVRMNNWP